ncbi:hypothetical protein PMAYCL1PPCAC_26062, partial [Pristionchus mayeri]
KKFSLLLHTWSLAVEIQFYLIAPLLYFLISFPATKGLRIVLILILTAVSLTLYSFSDATTQFYSLQCRIWQFLLGFLASNLVTEKKEFVMDRTRWMRMVAFALPATLSVTVLGGVSLGIDRIIVSICSAVIVLIGNDHQSRLLTNRLLTVVRDYSYELYLIHWPVIVLFNYSTRFHGLGHAIVVLIITISFFLVLQRIFQAVNIPQSTFTPNFRYTGILYLAIVLALIIKSKSLTIILRNQIDSLRLSAMEWAIGHEFFTLPPHEED